MLFVFALWAISPASGSDWAGLDPEQDPGWNRLDSGVYWADVRVGGTPLVTDGSGVMAHYRGYLSDGTQFDASYERGRPITFVVGEGRVIPGWEQGLVGAGPGTMRRLIIPPELGYGDTPKGEIPPGSTLYFEVEVVGLKPPRRAPEKPSSPSSEQLRDLGDVQVALLEEGKGPKLRRGDRICLDWTRWSGGELLGHSYDFPDCQWTRFERSPATAWFYEGAKGMRVGELRQIRDEDGGIAELRLVGVDEDRR